MATVQALDASVRDRLVAAAAEVFAERGYEGTRVQEVVRRAGLSTGAIYTNFRDKAELLLAAVGTAPVDSLFATMRLADGTSEGLRRAGHDLPTARRRHRPLLFEALVASRRDPEVAALLRERLLGFRSVVADVVVTGQVEGTVADDIDADATAEFCQALGMGFLLMEAVDLPHADDHGWRDLIDRVVSAIEPTEHTADGGIRTNGSNGADSTAAGRRTGAPRRYVLARRQPDTDVAPSDQPGEPHGDQ